MAKEFGVNAKDLKNTNRNLILRLLCVNPPLTRMDITKITGLSAVTCGSIVNELIEQGFVTEIHAPNSTNSNKKAVNPIGRKPIFLDIAPHSPCICGIFIFRTELRIALSDFKARIFASDKILIDHTFTAEKLLSSLFSMYQKITQNCSRKIIGIGISSIGPIDNITGEILTPTNFYGIKNIPICSILTQKTGLPCFLLNDPSAAALAEKLYGVGKNIENFMFVNMYNGIGSGIILEGKLYQGKSGVIGELGHMSIDYNGPICDCGNKGCLEIYLKEENMIQKAKEILKFCPTNYLNKISDLNWDSIIEEASHENTLALGLLHDYCQYLSFALKNVLSLFNFEAIILSYRSQKPTHILEDILEEKLNSSNSTFSPHNIQVLSSQFGAEATLVGALALVMDKIFRGDLSIIP